MFRLALPLLLLLSACASSPRERGPVPEDFSISLELRGGADPAWFVFQPDGVLRAAVGERSPTSSLPLAVRRLRPAEQARLYELVQATGVLEQSDSPPRSDDLGVLIYATANRRVVETGAGAPDSDPALAELVSHLRRLAWIDR